MTGAITVPLGFKAAGFAAGIKSNGNPDLMLLAADHTCAAAGVFTQNLTVAAPVIVSREHVAAGRARAVLVNSGCANAATGEGGLADAREMARLAGEALGVPAGEILVASTGVIGVRLPMDKVRAGVPQAAKAVTRDNGAAAARAIMTTDKSAKESLTDMSFGGKTAGSKTAFRVGAMGKGAG